jgi:hypothetical protein
MENVHKKQGVSSNSQFKDWSCEIKKLQYGQSTNEQTVADCQKETVKIIINPTVGDPNPKQL